MIRVWDLFARVFHWTMVVTFFVAHCAEDHLLTLDVWVGYVLGVFVVMRSLGASPNRSAPASRPSWVDAVHVRFSNRLLGAHCHATRPRLAA
jgi:cytochrome b